MNEKLKVFIKDFQKLKTLSSTEEHYCGDRNSMVNQYLFYLFIYSHPYPIWVLGLHLPYLDM